ncbi:sigma-70 family RNA polymerase sigma factor [Paenibacillus sp. MBLB4367]|uniref:sigma-70 family RNA polymerase sigma factor n=1 Tax=Paenibacillus sp. MBLB4367 TaxID=3384767 RepID=UPI003907EB11
MELDYLKYVASSDNPEAILQQLMEAHGQDVWHYAYTIVKRTEAADDIAQDVFLKAYRQLYAFRGESSVKTWLLTITRNTALNYVKSAFIRKVTLLGFRDPGTMQRSAEQEALEKLRLGEIWGAVFALPGKYREVIILDAHYRLSIREMAAMLNVSEGTVKSRLHRARAKAERMLRKGDTP